MRKRLARYYQQTHVFNAKFMEYSKTPEGSNVCLLGNICIGGHWVADHVWIHRSKAVKRLELMHGDHVRFEAQVDRYARNHPLPPDFEVEYDYGLVKIREFIVLKRKAESEEA